MPHLRCLTIEPSADAAATLRYLLESDWRVASVHAVPDLDSAADALEHRSADAIFVCLAAHTATQLHALAALPWRPAIIAMAPSTDYAMAAFAIGAVDFILKPATRTAVERALDRLANVTPHTSNAPPRVRIPIQREDEVAFVDSRDIYYVESDGDYTKIVSVDGSDYCRFSMATLIEKLGPVGFIRIHRRWLVSAGRIQAMRQEEGKVTVAVAGCELPVARRLAAEVRARLT